MLDLRCQSFSLDRSGPIRLSCQIAEFLSQQIAAGILRGGEAMPSTRMLRDTFGVAHRVAADALRLLAEEGKVTLRAKSCAVVNAERLLEKNGVVLMVFPDRVRHLPSLVVEDRIMHALHASGYVARPVTICRTGRRGGYDLTFLRAELQTRNELAVCYNVHPDILRLMDAFGQPYVNAFGSSASSGSGACVGCMAFDRSEALDAFVRHCATRKVGKVLLASKWKGDCSKVGGLLSAAGIASESWVVPTPVCTARGEAVERDFYNAFDRRLTRRGTSWLPELVFFNDDFACYGALMALQAHRVSVPDDIRIVTVANRGLMRPFPFSLTRIEYNYASYGDAVAKTVCDYLRRGTFADGQVLGPVYRKGDSFR